MENERKIILAVIERCAPDESFIAEHWSGKETRSSANGPLGSGVELAIAVVTPFVFQMVKELESELAKDLAKSLAERIANLFRRGKPNPDDPELATLVAGVEEKLLRDGISSETSHQVALAITEEWGSAHANGR